MKRIKFNKFALSELVGAAHYYEDKKANLGKDFLKKVRKALEHIRLFPDSGTILDTNIRRHTVRRFHHIVIYSNEIDHIYVVSIMNQSRHPEHWKDNLKKESE